jgi:hypothetical protein
MGARTLTELRTGPPLHAAGFTLVPIEELSATVRCERGRLVACATKRAVGVVVSDTQGKRAFDETGRPIDLGELRARLPEL